MLTNSFGPRNIKFDSRLKQATKQSDNQSKSQLLVLSGYRRCVAGYGEGQLSLVAAWPFLVAQLFGGTGPFWWRVDVTFGGI